MRKRVLIISQTDIFSGAEIVLHNYINSQNQHDLFIYTNCKDEISSNYRKVMPQNKQFYSQYMTALSLKSKPYLLFLWVYYLLVNLYVIHKIVKNNDIDVLYGNNSRDVVLITLYKRFINKHINIIAHIHDMLRPSQISSIFLKMFNNIIDRVIVPSQATKNCILKFVELKRENIEVVYNGIESVVEKKNYNELMGNPETEKVIAFVGMINKGKRPDLFVDIISKLNSFYINFHALILGKDVDKLLKAGLEERIKIERLPIKILEPIHREQMGSFYEKIDILVLTSDRDSLPTVALEAMAKGKLVFSRAVDGICEIIENQRNGFTFDYDTNDMKKIAEQLFKILSTDEEELNVIRKNAIQTIRQRFSLEQKNKVINQIIGSL